MSLPAFVSAVGYLMAFAWPLMIFASALVSFLRGYTAMYGFMLGFFSIAVPVAGPFLALLATERWTREPPEVPIHPVRWPYRPARPVAPATD